MNSLLELNSWVEQVKSLVVTDDNLNTFDNFMRFSPEKFADKLNIERAPLVKEFDSHKKIIHNKIILYKKVKELKKREVKSSTFYFKGKLVNTKICYCSEVFKIGNAKFYPSIKYLYFYINNELFILVDENRIITLSNKDFSKYFIDKREETINKILNDK